MTELECKTKTQLSNLKRDEINNNSCKSSQQPKIIQPEIEPLSWKFWRKNRYILVVCVFFGLFNVYALRVNMSIAIVAMTKIHTIHYENETIIEKQDFNWNSKEKGLILSSFFYGYIMTQILGGYLCTKYAATMIFGGGILMTSIFTILTPLATKFGFYAVFSIRLIEGFFEGATFPSLLGIWARWAPPNERARMNSLVIAGNYIGTLIAMPVSSKLAESLGWESVFYVFGIVGIIWWLTWFWIVKEKPGIDKSISKDERRYIEESIGFAATNSHKNNRVPWKNIFTSVPVWAIIFSYFVENWGVYTMITQLPPFLIEAFGYSLQMAGNLSGIPHFGMALFLPLSGFLADYLTTRKYITRTQARKYSTCFSFFSQAIFLLATAWLMDPIGSIICVIIGSVFGAFAYTGFYTNVIDMAPQYASVIVGIANTIGTIPGIVSPTLAGFIVQNGDTSEWAIVFYIGAGLYLFGGIVYWIWCSAEVQSWAFEDNDEEKTSNDSIKL